MLSAECCFQNFVTSVKLNSPTFIAGTTISKDSSPLARTAIPISSTLESIAIKLWSELHGGIMGRSPDYLNVTFALFAAAASAFWPCLIRTSASDSQVHLSVRHESEARPGANSMSQMAEDIHALLEQLDTGPVVLIGHSMGGYVAFAFARKYPEMLRGLVLVGTKAGADTAEAAAGRRATAEKVKTEGAHIVVDAMAPKMLTATNTDQAMARSVRGFMEGSHPEGVIGSLLGMAERDDPTPSLSQINVPTLVIAGADDTVIPPSESQKLASAIKGARLELIPGAGHLVAFEKPDEFNRVLRDWLKTSVHA